jgi:hypothetical protein
MDRVEPHGMQGHVSVCGLQDVGLRAVEQFHLSGTQVVVIDDHTDPRFSRTGPYEELLRVLKRDQTPV